MSTDAHFSVKIGHKLGIGKEGVDRCKPNCKAISRIV